MRLVVCIIFEIVAQNGNGMWFWRGRYFKFCLHRELIANLEGSGKKIIAAVCQIECFVSFNITLTTTFSFVLHFVRKYYQIKWFLSWLKMRKKNKNFSDFIIYHFWQYLIKNIQFYTFLTMYYQTIKNDKYEQWYGNIAHLFVFFFLLF